MKVLFVYPDMIGRYEQPVGLLTLISVVKNAGHEVFFYSFPIYSHDHDRYQAEFKEVIIKIKPDVVGFSTSTHLHENLDGYYRVVKDNSKALILEGGIHPTMFPEETISNENVDIIGIGECEKSVNPLLARIENGHPVGDLEGYWYRHDGDIIKNPVGMLPCRLDELPFPDRTVLSRHIEQGAIEAFNVISSRGCSYECSYCHNIFLKKYYKGKGAYVRFRPVENVISELKEIMELYPHIKRIIFSDDNFALDKQRLLDLCRRYKKEINLPFVCHARVENIDDEVLCSLKEANCVLLNSAIETANDHLRNGVLNRKMSKEKIRRVFRNIKGRGLRAGTFIMLGIPGETRETIWETIRLLRDVDVNYAQVFSFTPLRKTPIYERCVSKGYTINKVTTQQEFDFGVPVLELDTISKETVAGYVRALKYYIKAPRAIFPFIHGLRYLWNMTSQKDKRIGRYLAKLGWVLEKAIKKLLKNKEEPLFLT